MLSGQVWWRPLAVAILLGAAAARAEFVDAPHPFILWNKEDVAQIRKKIQTEPWAKQRIEELPNNTLGRLFRFAVLGDARAGKAERDYLLSFRGAAVGGGKDESGNNTGLRYDNHLAALRYDVLYDTLTPEERQGVQEQFRACVQYELDHPYVNTRLSLLPNMQLPRMCSALLLSVALKDEALIRKLWNAPSGYRWFFEDYLSDGRFYNEEWAKMPSLIGTYCLYARGLDRLGLSKLGFDFVGKNGGSLRRYIESDLELSLPGVRLYPDRPVLLRVPMGDVRGGGLLQLATTPPVRRDGTISVSWYSGANMQGRDHRRAKVDKLAAPHWYEMLAQRYPDDPVPRFLLLHLRGGQEEKYTPSLFWGLAPLDPAKVTPPAAPSYVAPERGFALLRAEESPAYWTAPAPAVGLQLAQLYVHYTSDCLALLTYHQFNRPLYVNRCLSAGYNGGPWDFHVRGHCGVVVDTEQAQPIGVVPVRSDFASPLVKFTSARGISLQGLTGRGEVRSSDMPKEAVTEVYSNTDIARALFLTRAYLFDVTRVADKTSTPRQFWWLVHAPGSAVGAAVQWQADEELQKTLFRTPYEKPLSREERAALPPARRNYLAPTTGTEGPDWLVIKNARRFAAGTGAVSIETLQTYHGPDVQQSAMGPEWYARKIGVRVTMLPGSATTAYTFDTPTQYTPGSPRAPVKNPPGDPEWGGVSACLHRQGPAAVFAAVHEPFENGQPNRTQARVIQQSEEGLAAAISGTAGKMPVNDRLLLAYDLRNEADVKKVPELERDPAVKPLTLAGDGESFTFVGHGFVRIGAQQVEVTGGVRALQVKVEGSPKLMVNGKEVPATIGGGVLSWRE